MGYDDDGWCEVDYGANGYDDFIENKIDQHIIDLGR